MAISVSIIALSSQLAVAVANGVPVFDVARTCKLDLAAASGTFGHSIRKGLRKG